MGDILESGLVKGKFSGRSFDPSKAGGPIQRLDWKSVKIEQRGIEIVKKHLSRFGKSSQNEKAVKRLEDILTGKTNITDYDKRFYTHELREYERYQALGIPDNVNDSKTWENAHSATLEDYQIHETKTPVYHPDTEPTIDDLLNEY
ncbi:MAG: S-type pyocin domain-containing protein [Bacteroidia bacterium]|nr:S-type pyocin domain-containing protein [Bacteroidia bacterium]